MVATARRIPKEAFQTLISAGVAKLIEGNLYELEGVRYRYEEPNLFPVADTPASQQAKPVATPAKKEEPKPATTTAATPAKKEEPKVTYSPAPFKTADKVAPKTTLADLSDEQLTNLFHITRPEVEAIKNSICPPGTADSELVVFLKACVRLNLDPFTRQIYLLDIRGSKKVVVGIDGYRSIAMETGELDHTDIEFDEKDDRIISATAHVWRKGSTGPTSRTAHWKEFARISGRPGDPWAEKPHVMIAKCAESQALRASFPKVLSGTYTPEELGEEETHNFPPSQPLAIHATPAPRIRRKLATQKQKNILYPMQEKYAAQVQEWVATHCEEGTHISNIGEKDADALIAFIKDIEFRAEAEAEKFAQEEAQAEPVTPATRTQRLLIQGYLAEQAKYASYVGNFLSGKSLDLLSESEASELLRRLEAL